MKRKGSFGFLLLTGILTFSPTYIPTVHAATYNASINTATTYQTLEGFGAAVAWEQNFITEHPNKRDLYDDLFHGLGLDILRIRNQYRNNSNFDYGTTEIIKTANLSLGHPIKLLLCSWSPPADLKKNAVLNGGTLATETDPVTGKSSFVYGKFADYWYNSLNAYAAKGIVPDYISIQNEPDYENSGWETCIFKPVEDANYPGFGIALDSVYNKLKTMPNPPKIIGAEASGLISNKVLDYTNNLNQDQLYGIAYHLYSGGDSNNPDSFNTTIKKVATTYPTKPCFMTEYSQAAALNTAQLINNSFVEGNSSSYMFWDLIWDGQNPLVKMENPWNSSSWTSSNGYILTDNYYVFKQYSKFTDPGYKRVDASTSLANVKISSFISPDKKQLTTIIINKGTTSDISLNLNGFSVGSSKIYRTVVGGTDKFASVGSLGADNTVSLPAQSVTTVVINTPDYVPPAEPSPLPITAKPSVNILEKTEAENYTNQNGIQTEVVDDNANRVVGYIQNNDYTVYNDVDFNAGITNFQARVSCASTVGNIEVRLDGQYSPTIATIPVPITGAWSKWTEITADLSGISGLTGKHDLYLVYTGAGSGYLFNIDWFKFTPLNTELLGDVNIDGVVNLLDYALIKKYIMGTITDFPSKYDLLTGDVNRDGKVNIQDLVLVKRFCLGRITSFSKK